MFTKASFKRFLLGVICLSSLSIPSFSDDTLESPAGYKEIPYYLRKLEESKLDDERLKFDKVIHDAIVNADLADKKIVKEMEPMIERVQKAMDSGLDRTSITGQSNWLESAVDYFDREKNRAVVQIPESDWLSPQSHSIDGTTFSTFPDRITLYRDSKTEDLVNDNLIHEAIISPDGKRMAYYKLVDASSKKAEVWVVNIAKKKKRKVASVPSCYSILFSENGEQIYIQAQPEKVGQESDIYVVSSGGGKPKPILKGELLLTLVAKGEYKGSLIVYKTHLHHLGVTKLSCPYAFTRGGDEIGRLVDGPCR